MRLGRGIPRTTSRARDEGQVGLGRILPPGLRGPGRRPAWHRTRLRRVVAASLVATAVWVTTSAFLPSAAPSGVRVVVVAHDLMAGHVLTSGDLVVASWPDQLTPAGTVEDSADLVGRRLGAGMSRGEPVTTARVRGPGLLTGAPAGMVAAHVRLADPAMASMTVAGDRVDVISAAGTLVAVNVAVLAVDASPTGTSGWSSTSSSSLPGGMIVAVAPDAALRLATIDPSGQLDATFSVVLRGPRN